MSSANNTAAYSRIRTRSRLVSLFPWLSRLGEIRQLLAAAGRWRREGWFVPVPHFVRRAMLLSQARAINARIFVETGTYKGGTTWCLLREFQRIETIEIVPDLAALATERFRNHAHVTVHEGDSSELLPAICARLDAPCLFYLDGHYSGGITGMGDSECPVIDEIKAIFEHTKPPFRIVIDDARHFGSDPAYPDLRRIESLVAEYRPEMTVRIENDAILIHGS